MCSLLTLHFPITFLFNSTLSYPLLSNSSLRTISHSLTLCMLKLLRLCWGLLRSYRNIWNMLYSANSYIFHTLNYSVWNVQSTFIYVIITFLLWKLLQSWVQKLTYQGSTTRHITIIIASLISPNRVAIQIFLNFRTFNDSIMSIGAVGQPLFCNRYRSVPTFPTSLANAPKSKKVTKFADLQLHKNKE